MTLYLEWTMNDGTLGIHYFPNNFRRVSETVLSPEGEERSGTSDRTCWWTWLDSNSCIVIENSTSITRGVMEYL
jgi:hypothetical protein